MDLFAKTVNDFRLLTIFVKSSILDVWQSSEYASAFPSLTQIWKLFLALISERNFIELYFVFEWFLEWLLFVFLE